MTAEDRYTRITLRIPKDLHSNLANSADLRSHSMNAEIIQRLSESFDPITPLEVMGMHDPKTHHYGSDVHGKINALNTEIDNIDRDIDELSRDLNDEKKLEIALLKFERRKFSRELAYLLDLRRQSEAE